MPSFKSKSFDSVKPETKPLNQKTTYMTVASELAALRATLEAKMQADDRERQEAKEQREAMSKDIQAIRVDASQTRNRVENLEGDMGKVKPVIAALQNGKAKLTGAVIVLGAIGSIVLGTLTYFKDHILRMIWGG